jgi:hypothetical protein
VEYSALSHTKGEKVYRDAEEMESFGVEALIPTGRLRALLGHLGITSTTRYWIKGVPHLRSSPGLGSSAGTRGQPLEHLSVMLWLMLPGKPSLLEPSQQGWATELRPPPPASAKEGQVQGLWVKNDVPRMEMVYHQEMMVELSTRLLAAQCEIESLRIQLWNSDATIQGYQRMVKG